MKGILANSRRDIHARFVARFRTDDAALPVTAQHLDAIETKLRTQLSLSYRSFMTTYGRIHTPQIVKEISDRELDHPDVQDFLGPQEAIDGTTGYWSAGMPEDIIGIASDCMGNMFGFARALHRLDDAPVFFFDHDFVTVHDVAPSFDALLSWYLDNLNHS